MSRLEDGLRDTLNEHAAMILPPTGWELNVLAAGRRRQRRRRAGGMLGAAIAVAAICLAVDFVVPQAVWVGQSRSLEDTTAKAQVYSGSVPASPLAQKASGGPIELTTLSTGAAATVAYAAGDGRLPEGDVVVLPDGGHWRTGAYVMSLEEAGDGVVAEVSAQVNRLMYRWPGGTRELARGNVSGYAVSSDGGLVAWTQTSKGGRLPAKLKLAELATGQVLRTVAIEPTTEPKAGVPVVSAFVGNQVALSYDSPPADSAPGYAWDYKTGAITSMVGAAKPGTVSKLLDVSPRTDTMLTLDREGCLANVSYKNPGRQRWRDCDKVLAAKRLSPKGTRFAGVQGSLLWVRDTETGKLEWSRELSGAEAAALVWETEDQVLVTYDEPGDKEFGRALLRCSVATDRCDRPSTVGGLRVTALASRQGTDPPLVGR
ncbi:hypothetical protein [Flindersiella endophytica]